jgi:hypothetical protein
MAQIVRLLADPTLPLASRNLDHRTGQGIEFFRGSDILFQIALAQGGQHVTSANAGAVRIEIKDKLASHADPSLWASNVTTFNQAHTAATWAAQTTALFTAQVPYTVTAKLIPGEYILIIRQTFNTRTILFSGKIHCRKSDHESEEIYGLTTPSQSFVPDESSLTLDNGIARIKDGGVTIAKLADGSVSATKLADGSVSAAKLADNSVSAAKLADNSVSAAKLADNSVSAAKLADNSVSATKLADNSVSAAKLADAGVTAAKLAGQQTGSAPIFGIRAWARITPYVGASRTNGYKIGTYTRDSAGTTVSMTSHGLKVGDRIRLDFTTGVGVDDLYQVTGVNNANQFVIAHAGASTSGNVTAQFITIQGGGNISSASWIDTTDDIIVLNFAIPMPNVNYASLISGQHYPAAWIITGGEHTAGDTQLNTINNAYIYHSEASRFLSVAFIC